MSECGSRQLDSQNHFLTLATTDGGDATTSAWVIWGDATIDVPFAKQPY
jgi:hypothetical protein